MPFRPISLIGLECILQYMEANKRFRTAQHCAAIRKAEKRVPLRIDFLQFEDLAITINDTEYNMAVSIKCNHTLNFLSHGRKIQLDLDHYCLPIPTTDTEFTPGDLIFNTERSNFEQDRQDIMNTRQSRLKTMEMSLQAKRCSQWIFDSVFNQNSIPELEAKIKEYEKNQEDFDFQREVVQNPCAHLLQLTISNLEKTDRGQQGVYNMKLGKAMKQLTIFLFSGRRHPVQVRRLKLVRTLKVLRLPEDMKLQVKNLEIGSNPDRFCWEVQSILTEDSFPLDFVSVRFTQREQFTPHEMIKKAKTVRISTGLTAQINHDIFSELECLELEMIEGRLRTADFIQIIQEWLITQKRVGTRYSFRVNTESQRVLDRMQLQFNGLLLDTGGVAIPMGDDEFAPKIYVGYQREENGPLRLVLEVLAE